MKPFYNPYGRNKYNNTKVEYNGVVYASKKEAEKAMEITMLHKAGEIIDWKPHPAYIVIPRFTKDGKIYRPTRYIADFWVKWKDGREEIIDIKGFPTEAFKIKAKLFNSRYPKLKLIIE